MSTDSPCPPNPTGMRQSKGSKQMPAPTVGCSKRGRCLAWRSLCFHKQGEAKLSFVQGGLLQLNMTMQTCNPSTLTFRGRRMLAQGHPQLHSSKFKASLDDMKVCLKEEKEETPKMAPRKSVLGNGPEDR